MIEGIRAEENPNQDSRFRGGGSSVYHPGRGLRGFGRLHGGLPLVVSPEVDPLRADD